jgi:hypothetical protein
MAQVAQDPEDGEVQDEFQGEQDAEVDGRDPAGASFGLRRRIRGGDTAGSTAN